MVSSARTAVSGISWLALVAACCVGSSGFDRLRAKVSAPDVVTDAEEGASGTRYRLVVQAYARDALQEGARPGAEAVALGSTQRAVSAEELRAGVSVDLFSLGQATERVGDAMVVAWVEPGEPDFALDAIGARPGPGAAWGTASAPGSGAAVELSLELARRADEPRWLPRPSRDELARG